MRKILLGIATLAVLSVSCKKDKDFIKATVLDTGDITVDGCGYLLRLEDGRDEKPVQLPSAYMHDGMKVLVKYHGSGVMDTCRALPPKEFYEKVVIDEIKKDLN
ncbi:MAG: hypothetical protein EOO01_19520 [Chitinophagaceae bacterium]|nr:MAG: hypothetical protein EOO01_19520 [Chitinophagaceae bacterium]